MTRVIRYSMMLFLSVPLSSALGEQTVGLFYNTEDSYKGYTLFSPLFYNVTYLIDNDGMLLHSWESDYWPGAMAYLSEDGYLYRSILTEESPRFDEFGGGVEKLDWDGNVIWRYMYDSDEHRQHHDICVLPSGNVLLLAWEHKSALEAIAAGRDPQVLDTGGIWPDHIVEVEPSGSSGGNVVWEWHVWDHMVQNFDSTKDNFGSVVGNPGLLSINYPGYKSSVDWTHLNSASYNAGFDQIMLSSREFSEIWIIDHSTTTEEARGHTAGKYGKGGDLLYRWGNPLSYGYGSEEDQYLKQQHDAQWIADGLPGAGNILIFNNANLTVDEIVPPVNEHGNYIGGAPWGPQEPLWYYSISSRSLCNVMSGAERMPNGNTLIAYGPSGVFSEVKPDGEIVWSYVNPVTDKGPVKQGEIVKKNPPMNQVYKIRRYPLDYPAFLNRDLTPQGPIELPGVEEAKFPKCADFKISSSLTSNHVVISYQIDQPANVSIKVYNSVGQEVRELASGARAAGGNNIIWDGTDDSGLSLSSGVYFIRFETGTTTFKERVILVR